MGMINSVVYNNPEPSPSFPKLMIGTSGLIVLFHGYQTGTVVGESVNADRKAGYYSDSWAMDQFEDFDGEVALSNSTRENKEGTF